MYIYTYNPQSQPTILTLFLLILSLQVSVLTDHLQATIPTSYVFVWRITTLQRRIHFLLLCFLQLFFLDFLLKFSTSQLIHLYFCNLYTYVKLHELLESTTSKIFKSFKWKQKLNLIKSQCVLYHKWRWSVGTETCSERIKRNKVNIVGCDCGLYVYIYIVYIIYLYRIIGNATGCIPQRLSSHLHHSNNLEFSI
jgi:hypothetical protein